MKHPLLLCPNCSQPMVLARTLPTITLVPEKNVYECTRCNLSFHHGRPPINIGRRSVIKWQC